MGREAARGGRGFQRRAAHLEPQLHFRVGNPLLLDALPQRGLQLGEIGHLQRPRVPLGGGLRRDHVAVGTCLRDRPVQGQALVAPRQVAQLQHLMRQLEQRVDALVRRGTSMRGLAVHRQVRRADAAGGQTQVAVRSAAFVGEHGVLFARHAGDGAARAR